MFGLLDRKTSETARVLMARAIEADGRYFALSRSERVAAIKDEFEETRRFVSSDQVSFGYDDLPDFNFTIMDISGGPIFSIFGMRRYRGFMLQKSGPRWFTDMDKPLAAPLGSKTARLVDSFGKQFGVVNLRESLGRFRRW